jgi:hypothetical protein
MYRFLKIALLSIGLSFTGLQDNYGQEKQKITTEDYQNNEITMADVMRSNGKIYIVVATIIALFAGIIVYLILLDKKIGKLEEQFAEEQKTSVS